MEQQFVNQVNQLTNQYNDTIQALEDAFNAESISQLGWNLTSSHLKKQYSKKYEHLAHEYQQERQRLLNDYKLSHPEWTRQRKWWGRAFIIVIILMMGSCIGILPSDEEDSSSTVADGSAVGISEPSGSSTVSDGSAVSSVKYWSAADIPIPFLQDSTQYVSNPDRVLSQNTVDSMNVTLKLLDNKLNIQSVVVVVNHIKNDDPFRMAQDIGNKYGVGRNNRGLIIVVGYQDHSINMSPGRALEGDLTDVECNQLEQRYVIPAMRAQMPDSAMLYLTEGLYAMMAQKEMPQMSLYDDSDDEDEALGVSAVFFFLILAWCIFYLYLNRKYHWLGLVGAVALLPNPFYVASSSGGFGGGGFGGGHSSGGGFSGGSFGGGSFGGGGATSRW